MMVCATCRHGSGRWQARMGMCQGKAEAPAASGEARAEACAAPLSRCYSREVVKACLMPPAKDIVGEMRTQQLNRNLPVSDNGSGGSGAGGRCKAGVNCLRIRHAIVAHAPLLAALNERLVAAEQQTLGLLLRHAPDVPRAYGRDSKRRCDLAGAQAGQQGHNPSRPGCGETTQACCSHLGYSQEIGSSDRE